jgi:hypothetical protein
MSKEKIDDPTSQSLKYIFGARLKTMLKEITDKIVSQVFNL